jgi:hypothetical protein
MWAVQVVEDPEELLLCLVAPFDGELVVAQELAKGGLVE